MRAWTLWANSHVVAWFLEEGRTSLSFMAWKLRAAVTYMTANVLSRFGVSDTLTGDRWGAALVCATRQRGFLRYLIV